jgi:hypothetical protein
VKSFFSSSKFLKFFFIVIIANKDKKCFEQRLKVSPVIKLLLLLLIKYIVVDN